MNILLIAPKFYSYDLKIKNEIESQGHSVDLFCEYKENYLFFTRFISRKIKDKFNFQIQKKILSYSRRRKYDIVLVIVGRFLSKSFLEKLKYQQNSAKFILYLWDDVKRCNSFHSINCFFDLIYSFDRINCTEFGFKFLPLFYTHDYLFTENVERTIPIYSSLFAHSDRIQIVKQIVQQTQQSFFYVYFASKVELIKYFFSKKKTVAEKQIHAKNIAITQTKNIKYMQKSKCVLDIQHPSQSGLTMRAIETIGCRNKLITTNSDIVNYDFYNENNVLIIDRDNPIIPEEFIDKEYILLPKDIYDKYLISSFVKKLIEG